MPPIGPVPATAVLDPLAVIPEEHVCPCQPEKPANPEGLPAATYTACFTGRPVGSGSIGNQKIQLGSSLTLELLLGEADLT